VEREAIFRVHIGKRKRDPERYDLDALVAATQGYVGAEIEQGLIDALCLAFNDRDQQRNDFTTEDILRAIGKLVPMSRSQREAIEALRTWLAVRSPRRSPRSALQSVRSCRSSLMVLAPTS
jgi:SpoVK/Ycf46/Vps4 family AAA+-type ATPase